MPAWVRGLTWAGRAAALAAVAFVALTQPAPTSIVGVGSGTCQADWCTSDAIQRDAQALIDGQLAALTAGRDCWTPDARPGTIPATVMVKGAKVDKSVVWEIGLDEAFAVNEDGDSWDDVIVVAACS